MAKSRPGSHSKGKMRGGGQKKPKSPPPERRRAPASKKALKPPQITPALPVPSTGAERIRHPELTEREQVVLDLFILFLGNAKKVAARLGTSQHTVRNQLASIEKKLKLAGRMELLLHFQKQPPEPDHQA